MRYAAATLVLLLGACAPYPAQERSPEPSAPPGAGAEEATEPEATPTNEPEPGIEPATDAEAARPVQPSEDPVSESTPEGADRDAAEATQPERAQPGSEAAARPEQPPAPDAGRNLTLSGRIILTGGDAAPEEAVVYFVPDDIGEMPDTVSDPETEKITTRDKSLSPTVLAVSRGSEIRFPNEDPILHNLFSVSAGNDFDLGVYGPGDAPSVTFDEAGVVNIYCNVHHDMHAHVLVLDTPFRTRPDPNGEFRLNGLPAGPGELHVWHRQSDRWSRPLELPSNGELEVSLQISKPRLPPHRDKTGQSYNRRDRDPYR